MSILEFKALNERAFNERAIAACVALGHHVRVTGM